MHRHRKVLAEEAPAPSLCVETEIRLFTPHSIIHSLLDVVLNNSEAMQAWGLMATLIVFASAAGGSCREVGTPAGMHLGTIAGGCTAQDPGQRPPWSEMTLDLRGGPFLGEIVHLLI